MKLNWQNASFCVKIVIGKRLAKKITLKSMELQCIDTDVNVMSVKKLNEWKMLVDICSNSSIGRAPRCQRGGYGIVPRLLLGVASGHSTWVTPLKTSPAECALGLGDT